MRIAIIDDHALFAAALETALTLQGHEVRAIAVDTFAGNHRTLLKTCLTHKPGMVLLDLDLGDVSGTVMIEPLVRAGVAVVVLTGSTDRARWGEALRLGASTVVPKSASLQTVSTLIQVAGRRGTLLSPEDRDLLIGRFEKDRDDRRDAERRLDQLSSREREVLAHLLRGRSASEIARASFVSEATVRTQIRSILAKLGVTSQIAAVGLASGARWRPPAVREPR